MIDARSFDMFPWTTVFYSFRGGVGRTTLAVNSVSSGDLIIDFDLEAPGVDEFERLKPPTPDQMGLVEYISDYRKTGRAPDIRDYIYRGGYSLFVMRAGRRDIDHRRFLAEIDWNHFYSQEDGFLFFENLKAGVKKEFGCNKIIVDSRTGLTDIGSICTGHLADVVVLIFQPTTAHQQGLIDIVNAIRMRERREERPIPRLYVISKLRAQYENEIDSEIYDLAIDTICRCEDKENDSEFRQYVGNSVSLNSGDCDQRTYEEYVAVHDIYIDVLAIPARDTVRNAHLPDAYLYTAANPNDTLGNLYDNIPLWINDTRAYVLDTLAGTRRPPFLSMKDIFSDEDDKH